MSEISEQLKQAFQLRKDKKPAEAIGIYHAMWPQHATAFGEWDGWSYGQCLKELKRYPEALDICRQLYPRFKTAEMILQLYAWCIYYTQLAGDKQPADKAAFIKILNAITQLSAPGKAFSPAVKSIFKLVKFLTEGNQNDWHQVGEWLQKLDKEKLSKDTYSIDVPGKKRMELASELEEWYSWQSKYLLQTRQWEKTVDICNEALAVLNKWHYSNDIWFARRKAAALTQLGHKALALETLQPLIKRKREWFMLADLAELTDDKSKALKLYAEAALACGDMPKKIRVYFSMAILFNLIGDKDLAKAHAMLVHALRIENGWPVPAELNKMLLELGELPKPLPNSFSMLRQLKPKWQNMMDITFEGEQKIQPVRLVGKIDCLLTNGQAGFIKGDLVFGKIYFLFRNYKGAAVEIIPGMKVSYEVVKDFDKKKNRDSEMAVRIKKIE